MDDELVRMTWAHGVVVSHPLSMREALGSIPSVSITRNRTDALYFKDSLFEKNCLDSLVAPFHQPKVVRRIFDLTSVAPFHLTRVILGGYLT